MVVIARLVVMAREGGRMMGRMVVMVMMTSVVRVCVHYVAMEQRPGPCRQH
jgi:hypothetical protein